MSRADTNRPRWSDLDQEAAQVDERLAEEDAAAAILAMLTSARIESECICDGDGAPLSVATSARIGMWF